MADMSIEDYYDERELPDDVIKLKRFWATMLLYAARDYAALIARMGALRGFKYKNDESRRVAESKHRVLFADGESAKRWIYSEADGVTSFRWVCEILGFNPERVRTQIERNWRTINTTGIQGKQRKNHDQDEG